MPQILVIFGSQSDDRVFKSLMPKLNSKNLDAELKICSAHRNPKELGQIISQTDAKVIVCGAGLSAALPGVVASQTSKPVIGIPVKSNYDGLDALLSIHQMPSNVPVLGVGVECVSETARNLVEIFSKKEKIAVLKTAKGKKASLRVQKAAEVLQKKNVPFEIFEKLPKNFDSRKVVLIEFVDLKKTKTANPKNLTIFVPVCEKTAAADALKLLKLSKKGLWVGLNRGENAAIAAARLLNL